MNTVSLYELQEFHFQAFSADALDHNILRLIILRRLIHKRQLVCHLTCATSFANGSQFDFLSSFHGQGSQ